MFGPLSPSPRRLKVLCRTERNDRVAVAEEEQRNLWAAEKLLDQHTAFGQVVFGVAERRRTISAHEHPLACGESVSLDHVWCAEFVERIRNLGQ